MNIRHSIKPNAGFTLVELLIVVVIVGILSAVVISVLNPLQQQHRAQDGTTKAQLDKMAISAKSLFVSSPRQTDRSPTLSEFGLSFASSSDIVTNCTNTATNVTAFCLFTMDTLALPALCSANGYSNVGTNACNFIYWRSPNEFMVAARGVATPARMFVYHFREDLALGTVVEGFYACPVTYDVVSGSPSTPTCDRL